LRGLAPKERVPLIINNCAHPDYKDQLNEYYNRALFHCTKTKSLHEPHSLKDAFKMHVNLQENGTMKLDSWDVKF
jgi:acetyl-CoA hydrolase